MSNLNPDWRIGLVGPLPPPPGGIANQTRQLAHLLREDGLSVELVCMNPAYRPEWIGAIRGVRAMFRLFPYIIDLWKMSGRVNIIQVMANSGWAWYLFSTPAIWIGYLRGVPVIVNYRGGGALPFFERAWPWIRPAMLRANQIIVPSGFLQNIFRRFGVDSAIVPNVVDLSRFYPVKKPLVGAVGQERPHLVVTRNLESIYDNATAIRALVLIRSHYPQAHLTIAGDGAERPRLQALVQELQLASSVKFTGRLDNKQLPGLYQDADIMLNPSLTDNTPNSVLEALASGVVVVSTHVGGVPYLVEHGRTALLVPPSSPQAMAEAVLSLLNDPQLADRLRHNGLEQVRQFTWGAVRDALYAVYEKSISC